MSYHNPDSHRLPQGQQAQAGASLRSSDAVGKFGHKATIGAQGETYFAQAIAAAGLDRLYATYYSLSLPVTTTSRQHQKSDVDAAVVNGNTIVLIDVKRWKGGTVLWSVSGLPFSGLSPLVMDNGWKLSANMAAAVRRFKEALPGAKVSAMVVFVPTQRGSTPTSVRWLKWPGDIRSYLLADASKELTARLGSPAEPALRVQSLMNSLRRGG